MEQQGPGRPPSYEDVTVPKNGHKRSRTTRQDNGECYRPASLEATGRFQAFSAVEGTIAASVAAAIAVAVVGAVAGASVVDANATRVVVAAEAARCDCCR